MKYEIPDHMWARVAKGQYGFAVPHELIPLIQEFDEKAKAIAPNYIIHQIKEKFLTLRIYVTMGEDFPEDVYNKFQSLVDEYEQVGTSILEKIYGNKRH